MYTSLNQAEHQPSHFRPENRVLVFLISKWSFCHSRHYVPTDPKKQVKSSEEVTETSTDDAIEDLDALERGLFDCIEVAENWS